MAFDDPGVFVGDRFFADEDDPSRGNDQSLKEAKRKFKSFLKTFHMGGFTHLYRDELRRRYNLGEFWLEINVEDLKAFDDDLENNLKKKPSLFMPLFEEAAREVADEITKPRPAGQEDIMDVQVMLKSDELPLSIRNIKSTQVSQLVKVPGIIIAASQVRSKAQRITIQCRSCRHLQSNIHLKPGLEGYVLPRRCASDQTGQPIKCPMDPYFIVADRCKCVDFQTLKLQENPEDVPQGEMPRHLQLFCDRYMTDRIAPGNRVTVIGVYSIKRAFQGKRANKDNVGIRAPYLRVLGVEVESSGPGRNSGTFFSAADEEQFRNLARQPNIYERIAKSIAPSIYGSDDIKKAIACLLFGGARKRMPDGLTRRGDINVLLLGDPGTAKSQLLKFVEKVSPIGVYTSGKGSSAAGLTAAVIRDPISRGFIMEGGAMVLADGGVVCIDEFDKMREDDRVAIHEAMEQQTISIAKAGITTTLNSRCSVLAAANSIFGRWDESRGDENIDFMPTILSRFDMIFLVKDEHNEKRDMTLAKHVMNVHLNAFVANQPQVEGELSLGTLKKYIAFCKTHCGPRLSASAAETLKHKYVKMRDDCFRQEHDAKSKSAIPITVRQLEAIIRISESLAKMELSPFATERHVEEATRLFHVSTLEAAKSGSLAGAEGFTTEQDHEMLGRIEKQLKRRFAIGTQVSEHAILQDFQRQNYPEHAVFKVIHYMIRRGEVQHRMQRKMLYRLK